MRQPHVFFHLQHAQIMEFCQGAGKEVYENFTFQKIQNISTKKVWRNSPSQTSQASASLNDTDYPTWNKTGGIAVQDNLKCPASAYPDCV